MYQTIETAVTGRVATIRFDRPDKLNALNSQVMQEVLDAATGFDADSDIGCLVLTGTGRAFAAGADIKELAQHDYASMYAADYFAGWDRFAALRLPKLAAVNGFALGGGCEVAMMCDVILAGEAAKFGQPEIKIGCIPGIGGTQRLTRLIGRARAMDLILTGRMITADEALQMGLVSRVIPDADLAETAMAVARISPRHRDDGAGLCEHGRAKHLGQRHPVRTSNVPRALWIGGPKRRHGRVYRKAATTIS